MAKRERMLLNTKRKEIEKGIHLLERCLSGNWREKDGGRFKEDDVKRSSRSYLTHLPSPSGLGSQFPHPLAGSDRFSEQEKEEQTRKSKNEAAPTFHQVSGSYNDGSV